MERFHRTLLEAHLRVQERNKFYETLEEMRKDLKGYLLPYNTKRPQQGRKLKGRTPAQAFREELPKDYKGGTKKAA